MFASSQTPKRPISDPDKLLAYAAWYYGRYAPPLAKLSQKLREKASSPALADEVLERFSRYADDRSNLESKVSAAARGGKNLFKTRAKLVMKGFDKDEVRSVIDAEDAFGDWSVRLPAVERRLGSFVSKGKSRTAALSAIRADFPEFRDRLDLFVRENYPEDREILANFHGLPGSLPETEPERKKAHDRLLRAGFRYSDLAPFFETDE